MSRHHTLRVATAGRTAVATHRGRRTMRAPASSVQVDAGSLGLGGTTVAMTPGGTITIEPLRDGDTETVQAVFDGLGVRARRWRFGKTELQPRDFACLAGVGAGRHVVVARAGQQPVGLAHLVRDDDPSSAEVALAVGDEWQGIGIGDALARRLAADATAAGITRVHALIAADNQASLAVMRTATTIVSREFEGPDVLVVGEVGRRPRPITGSASARVPSGRVGEDV